MSNALEAVRILTNDQSTDCQHEDGDCESISESEDIVSLVTAINRKYFSEQCGVLPVGSTFFMKTTDYLPGKRRASGSLELLVLNEQHISVAGDLRELTPMVKNITELDLAFNRLSSWREVFTMLTQMPHLVHANLSHNPLNGILTKDEDWLSSVLSALSLNGEEWPTMTKINSLVLNATGVQWESLFTVLDFMPNLEELHLSLNDYSNILDNDCNPILTTTRSFPHVHNLHLNHCQMKSWRSLLAICRLFPCLETVIATSNAISSIGNEGNLDAELAEYFGCLHTLNINYWPLENWEDVDKIRRFPLLSELRINHVPLLQPLSDLDRRNFLIARLPDITLMNGSPVTSEQRENAERFFLRFYLDAETKPDRYFELETIHGRLMPLAEIDLSPKGSAEIVLIMDELRERHRISLNQSVGELKKALQTFCHMPPGRFRLFFRNKTAEIDGDPCFEQELKFPKIMLHSLSVEDGDEFLILPKPEPIQRRRTSSSNSMASCPATSPSKSNAKTCSSCSPGMNGGSPVKR